MKALHYYLIALVVVALDQASKYAITSRISFGNTIPVLGQVFQLTAVRNPGGAFGLFQSWAGLLTVLTLSAVIVIFALITRRAALPVLWGIALALLLGGAGGNLIDRIRLGYVVDFLQIPVWPVFNLSDVSITTGIALLGYHLIFCDGRKVDVDAVRRDPLGKA